MLFLLFFTQDSETPGEPNICRRIPGRWPSRSWARICCRRWMVSSSWLHPTERLCTFQKRPLYTWDWVRWSWQATQSTSTFTTSIKMKWPLYCPSIRMWFLYNRRSFRIGFFRRPMEFSTWTASTIYRQRVQEVHYLRPIRCPSPETRQVEQQGVGICQYHHITNIRRHPRSNPTIIIINNTRIPISISPRGLSKLNDRSSCEWNASWPKGMPDLLPRATRWVKWIFVEFNIWIVRLDVEWFGISKITPNWCNVAVLSVVGNYWISVELHCVRTGWKYSSTVLLHLNSKC